MKAIRTDGVYRPADGKIDGTVVVYDGDEIVEICDDVPADATVDLDVDGYAMPGLVDAHSHSAIRPWEGNQIKQLQASPAKGAIRAANNLRMDLRAGTTTMRLMGSEHHLDVDLAALERDGELSSPRLLPSGIHLTPTGGHGEAHTATDGPDEIRERIRENAKAGAHHVKYFATGGVSSATGGTNRLQYSNEEVRAIVEEADRQGMHVATHAHGGPGVRQALEAGVDTIEHAGALDEALADRLASEARHAVGTFTILHSEDGIESGDGRDPAIMEKVQQARTSETESWRAILERDIPVALGTDSMHGFLPDEVLHLIDLGVSARQALKAVTTEAARAIRVADEAGRLAPGTNADVLVVSDPPHKRPETLKTQVAVVKRGEIVSHD